MHQPLFENIVTKSHKVGPIPYIFSISRVDPLPSLHKRLTSLQKHFGLRGGAWGGGGGGPAAIL
jgi:hypothetical protein